MATNQEFAPDAPVAAEVRNAKGYVSEVRAMSAPESKLSELNVTLEKISCDGDNMTVCSPTVSRCPSGSGIPRAGEALKCELENGGGHYYTRVQDLSAEIDCGHTGGDAPGREVFKTGATNTTSCVLSPASSSACVGTAGTSVSQRSDTTTLPACPTGDILRLRANQQICTDNKTAVGPPFMIQSAEKNRPIYVVSPVRFMNNRAQPGQAYVPTRFEHMANTVTHGLIIAPAVLGLYWMMSLTATNGQYWAALIYGAATLAMFVTSTTFHCLCYHTSKHSILKEVFHYGDRAMIYIFIAGSYTPWLLLRDYYSMGTFTLYCVWIMAAAGIIYQYNYHEEHKWLETLLYLTIAICPSTIILAMKDTTGLYEMWIGGFIYTIGVVFFKCDGVIPFAHAIWHCFVFVGAVLHYVAVCKYLLGKGNVIES